MLLVTIKPIAVHLAVLAVLLALMEQQMQPHQRATAVPAQQVHILARELPAARHAMLANTALQAHPHVKIALLEIILQLHQHHVLHVPLVPTVHQQDRLLAPIVVQVLIIL